MSAVNADSLVPFANDLTKEMLSMSVEDLKAASQYPLTVLPSTQDLYELLARQMADEIKENNAKGQPTRWILPVGPKSQYPILAKICNDENISWKDVHAFHMDEWLDWQGRPVPDTHPFSFVGFCQRYLYDILEPELCPPKEQIVVPSIYDIDGFSKRIQEVGGIDTCFAGFGHRGHMAFNEPPSTRWHKISADEMANSKTRVIKLLEDTLVALSQRMTGGQTQEIPPQALTVGMKDILSARKLHLLTDGGAWKQYILRVVLLTTGRDSDLPVTLCHGHPNIEVTVDASSAAPIDYTLHP